MSGLNKLKLTKFHYSASGTPIYGVSMDALINPSNITHKLSMQYADVSIPGSYKPHIKFANANAETLDFTLYFDATGLVEKLKKDFLENKKMLNSLEQDIELLKEIVGGYDGDQHEVTYVKIEWGNLTFRCRLTSLTLKYTLFAPDGRPLRAEAACSFKESTPPKEEEKIKNKNSPDMTHVRVVKAGYTLRHMCYEIYGDGKLDVAVSKFNGFVGLQPPEGTEVILPPLRKS